MRVIIVLATAASLVFCFSLRPDHERAPLDAHHEADAARLTSIGAAPSDSNPGRRGIVQVDDHALKDSDGHFLGLGVSYFTALWRCKNDRTRLESDLAFLSRQGFNYFR